MKPIFLLKRLFKQQNLIAMIKFFRKIRKNLLNEGKTTKYFKYALGEIVLVVIGILIALYLNIQQEAYTIQKQQENYLGQIRGEMINNL